MSGGAFDYKQYELGRIADEIEERILKRNLFDGSDPIIRPDVLEKMREGVEILRRAEIYAHRIDWMLSGDDGEDTFLERLRQDLDRVDSPETMRWEGARLMLGDDELARLVMSKPGRDAWFARIIMTCLRGFSGCISGRDKAKTIADAHAEVEKRIRQNRAALLSRAREDYELAQRIAEAEFPKEAPDAR